MDVKEGAHEAPTKVYKGSLSSEERSHLIPELAQSSRVLQNKFIEAQKESAAAKDGTDIKSLPSWAADSTQAGIPSLDRGIKSRITSFCRREVVALVRKHLVEGKGLTKCDPTPFQHITTRKVPIAALREVNPFFIEAREFDKLFVNLLPNNVVLPALMHQLEEHILAHRVGVQEKVGIHVEENGNKVQLFHHAPTLAEVRGLGLPPTRPEHHYFIAFRYTEELVRFAAACAMPLEMTDCVVEQQDYEKFLKELELSVSVEGVPPLEVHDFINVGLHADTHPYPDSLDKIKREGRKRRLQEALAKKAAEKEAQLLAEQKEGGKEVADHKVDEPCNVSCNTPRAEVVRVLDDAPVEVPGISPPTTPRVSVKKRGGRKKKKQPKEESPPKSPAEPPLSTMPTVISNNTAEQAKHMATECEQADLSDPPAPKPPQRVGKKSKKRMFGEPPPYEAVAVWPPYQPMWTPEALQRVMGSVVLPKGTDLNMAPRGLLNYFHHPSQAVSPFRPTSVTHQALLTHNHSHRSHHSHNSDDDISIDDLLPKLQDDEDCEGVSSQPLVSTSDTPRITHDPDHRTIVDSLSEEDVSSTSSMNSSSSSFSSVVGSQRGGGGGGSSMWSSGTTSPFHQALDWRAPASPMAPLPPATGSKKVGRRSAKRRGPRVPTIPRPMRPADIDLPTSPPLYIPMSPPLPSTPTMALSLYRGVAPQPGRRRQLTVREALMRVLASGSGSANRRVQNRLAITGPPADGVETAACSDDESPRRQRLRASPQWQQRRRIRKALQRAGRTNWCTVNNPQARPKFQTVWRHAMRKRVAKRRWQASTKSPTSDAPPSSLVPAPVSAEVTVSEGDVLHARALLRKATFWGRDNVDTVSEAMGVDGTSSDTIQFHWNLPLPDTQSADSLSPSDPQHPTSQVRSLSTILHTALQHSYFMEGSALAMTMSSETVPTKHPVPPEGHPQSVHQPYTTRSMISVAVTADKSRLPVVSIPTAFLDRCSGAASSGSSSSPRDDPSHLNVLVALEPDSDDEGSTTSSVNHYTLPTNEQVISALHSMVEGGFGSPSSSTTSSPTDDKAKKGRGSKGSNKGGWNGRRRLSISELPASSLTGASKGRNNAIYFANSPLFRALEGFLNAAISQLPYVAVYPHRDGVITSAEPQLISTEEQPLLLLFLLLSGRGGEHGGLALPSSTFGQRLLM